MVYSLGMGWVDMEGLETRSGSGRCLGQRPRHNVWGAVLGAEDPATTYNVVTR